MKVRVIIITYNHERYIAQALDGVLMQETSFDWDLVVLDDCSTDGTRAILADYQQRYPDRVHLVLAPENKCSNEALVTAFEGAPSEYVAWLDGDDYWTSPHKLQRQVEFLDAHPDCALCFHNVRVDYESISWPSHNNNPDDQKVISTLDDLWEQNFIAGCSPMFRRGALPKLPAWYHTAIWGDWPLYILFAQKGQIGYVNEVMGVYRIHRGGYWSGLDNISKLESIVLFYKTMNTCLNHRYNRHIQRQIAKWRAVVALERSGVPHDVTLVVTGNGVGTATLWGNRSVRPIPGGACERGYPASGPAAIAELEALQAEGNTFLLVPQSSFWWLDHYKDLHHYLDASYQRIHEDAYCIVYQSAQAQKRPT